MVSKKDEIWGVFKAELNNRFLCLVNINGDDTLCYVPSSCRLSNFVQLEGKAVLVKPVTATNARTRYSLFAVKRGRSVILLNLSAANKIVEQQLSRRVFAFLGKRVSVSHEYLVDGYKTDLFVHDTDTIIEVKSLISYSKEASFPTVISERSVKQLTKIDELLKRGYKACYIIISYSPTVHSVSINRKDRLFYEAFNNCINDGMLYKAYSIRLTENIPVLSKEISFLVE